MYTTFFKRDNVKVALYADQSITKSVEKLCKPYILTVPKEQDDLDCWKIIISGRPSDTHNFQKVTYRPEGEPSCSYLYSIKEKTIFLDDCEGEMWLPQNALRLIRVILRLEFLNHGAMYLHGGMVKIENKGIGFIGRKKSGKTSSILSLISNFSAKYITNDDLCVVNDGENWMGLGWPRSISIRQDTFQRFLPTSSFDEFFKHPIHQEITIERKNEIQNSTFVYPSELADMFNTSLLEKGTLDMIVFPSFLPKGSNDTYIQKLDLNEATKLLLENIEINPGKFNEFLLSHYELPNKEKLEYRIKKLIESIPCYSLAQSFDNLDDGSKALVDILRKK
ncbi:hypothetical protein ACQVOM_12185 [Bacillus basilensis]|uniref:hypothetical protein n=1 Tax=Bacillus basilensis TaxID=3243721 RepID=UPI003D65F435